MSPVGDGLKTTTFGHLGRYSSRDSHQMSPGRQFMTLTSRPHQTPAVKMSHSAITKTGPVAFILKIRIKRFGLLIFGSSL